MAGWQNHNNLASQCAETLTRAIQREQYRPGEQLPSVERLAQDLGVGRSTVREALRLLQAQGQVEIVHGAGTFVTKERITRKSADLLSFSESVRERGMRPTSLVLGKQVIKADAEVASKLQIAAGDQVNVLRRLRLADDSPVSVETSVSSHARFPDLLDQDWGPETSLYELLRQRYGVNPHYSYHVVRAVLPGRAISRHLHIETRRPVLLVEILTMDEQSTPIEFGRSYYSSDRFEYRIIVKRERQ